MNVGDVVYLKNDAHPLVVKSVDGTDVTVYTHDPNGFLIEKTFPAAALTATDPTSPAA